VSGLALSVLSQAAAAHAAPAEARQLDLAAVALSDKVEVARGGTIRISAIATKIGSDTSPATMSVIISKQFGYPLIVENSGFMCATKAGSYLGSPTWEITCRKPSIAPATKSLDSIAFVTTAPNRAMSSAAIVSVWPDNATDVNTGNNVAQRNFKVR
jgi:hypothetical protein